MDGFVGRWCRGAARTAPREPRSARGRWLLPILVLGCALPARAAEPDSLHVEQSAREDHVVLGLKGLGTVERTRGHGRSQTMSGVGLGGMLERSFLHQGLALELDFLYLAPGDEHTFSTEPIAKLPYHLKPWLEPYAGVGPMLMLSQQHGQLAWLGGGQLVLGALLWFAEQAGLDLDLTLGAAQGHELSVIEATLAIGPVIRD